MPPHLAVFSWALKMILKFDDDEDEDDGSDGDGNDADKDDDDEDGLVPRQQRSLESGQRANFSFSVLSPVQDQDQVKFESLISFPPNKCPLCLLSSKMTCQIEAINSFWKI